MANAFNLARAKVAFQRLLVTVSRRFGRCDGFLGLPSATALGRVSGPAVFPTDL